MRPLHAIVLCAALVLEACASHPGFEAPGDFAVPSERGMFIALADVGASDKQRLAVMDTWDETHGRLNALGDEAQRVLQDWRELERRDAGFAKQSSSLAKRYSEIARERMTVVAKFEMRVASILDERQWDRWQRNARRPESGFGEATVASRGRGGTRRP